MRIGLFTDSYHPSTNGITVVVDIMRDNLQKLGHEVYIVAPAGGLRWWKSHEKNVIRFAGIKGLFFDEFLTSVFFPNKQYKRINALKLDAIVIFTPAQIGLLGAYCALTDNKVLISQYSTDLVEYVERYPAVMPGVVALYGAMPFALRSRPREVIDITKELARRGGPRSWKSHSIQRTLTFLHNRCDAVVSVSPKVTETLRSWGTLTPVYTISTGVDKGSVDQKHVRALQKKYGLTDSDKVLLSLGRVAKEKNIDLIIDAMPKVLKNEPTTKLLIVGDFSYRAELERKVADMGLEDSVIFTGRVPMAQRWDMYALADVFCFPSLTDTQALVVNEAGLMGLPIVWCDEGVNEILKSNHTGIKCDDTANSYAAGILTLLGDADLRKKYGHNAKKLACRYTETRQTKLFEKLLKDMARYKA